MYEFTSREEQSTEHRKLRAAEKVNSFTCRGISNLGGGGGGGGRGGNAL